MVHHLGELILRQRDLIECLKLRFEISQQGCLISDIHTLVVQPDELIDELIFENLFWLGKHGLDKHLLEQSLLEGLGLGDLGIDLFDLLVEGTEEVGYLGLFV